MPISLRQSIQTLDAINEEMTAFRAAHAELLEGIDTSNRHSAENLLDYLTFRSEDRSAIQHALAELGLSSLGRSEAAIRPQIQRVRDLMECLDGKQLLTSEQLSSSPVSLGREFTSNKANALFGPEMEKRHTRIMVTMPTEASHPPSMIDDFLHAGMNVARINCAHDNQAVWRDIALNIRARSHALGLPCKIMMDLAGPKLRTGSMPSGPQVIRVKPRKDFRGHVTKAAKVVFYPHSMPEPDEYDAVAIPLNCEDFIRFGRVHQIKTTDTRFKRRRLKVLNQTHEYIVCRVDTTTFFETGQAIQLLGDEFYTGINVASLPAKENFLNLHQGDALKLVADCSEAILPVVNDAGETIQPAVVSCCVPEILQSIEIGHRVKFDDGKFGAVVREIHSEYMILEVNHAPASGGKLRAEKGINFPDTALPVHGLTQADKANLPTVCEFADLVAISFVNSAKAVSVLQAALTAHDADDLGIILKIETPAAYQHLPAMLLTAMRTQKVGVMIARGDLGVEAGWKNMAEIQEEILWLCAAAHIPSIWATQVLESFAKTGLPTRSEITDAAMAQRAECVMLNKGPYMHKVIRMLKRIITTMDAHQYKRSARLPKLKVDMNF